MLRGGPLVPLLLCGCLRWGFEQPPQADPGGSHVHAQDRRIGDRSDVSRDVSPAEQPRDIPVATGDGAPDRYAPDVSSDRIADLRAASDTGDSGPMERLTASDTGMLDGSIDSGPLVIPIDCEDIPDLTRCHDVTEPDFAFDLCIGGICVAPGSCGESWCNVPGPHFDLADTGQTTWHAADAHEIPCDAEPCADDTLFCGQDGRYGWDSENDQQTRFSVLLGPWRMLADQVTHLTWQGCAAGIMGDQCEIATIPDLFSWSEALRWCEDSTWGGHEDWHLPDEHELASIVDFGTQAPAIDARFPNTPSMSFWTSTTGRTATTAVTVSFADGALQQVDKETALHARCVRGDAPIHGVARYLPFGVGDDSGIIDRHTDRIWTSCAAGDNSPNCLNPVTFSWVVALAYCEGLGYMGNETWRLPSIKELQTLMVPGRDSPSIAPIFPLTPGSPFWSSSNNMDDPTEAWIVDFGAGTTGTMSKAESAYIRCVTDDS